MTASTTLGKDPDVDAGRMQRADLTSLLATVRAATTITNQVETVLRRSDARLRASDFDALVFLVSEGPMRPAELLQRTALTVSPPTLHAILARLQERGFVERRPHPKHKRGVIYSSTPAGEAVIEDVWSAIERQVIHRFAGHFSDDEIAQLKDLSSRI